ncbi:MAG: peptide-methionine (S)-S-oxide reductase MsrA [Fimbriimonadaceae bacterium]|nr:peptide-methionine (S)-S-oxide reductase MsrA [Fimbriimonadaceae bacterium]
MRITAIIAGCLSLATLATGCVSVSQASAEPTMNPTPQSAIPPEIPATAKTLVVGGGCFWCIETLYEQLKGIYDVESGYAGGRDANVTYSQVSSGTTGHAEVIKITYDPEVITSDDLLHIFFTVHDPTTKDRQGGDVGPQYRSVIFVTNAEEREQANRIIKEITDEKVFDSPIVTTVEDLRNYVRAEEYHQDYYVKFENASPEERAKMNAGYCSYVITPKVAKFREKYKHLFKESN